MPFILAERAIQKIATQSLQLSFVGDSPSRPFAVPIPKLSDVPAPATVLLTVACMQTV